MKFAKNHRHSLNCGNSSLRSSNTPQFLTLIPRFSLRKFHKAEKKKIYQLPHKQPWLVPSNEVRLRQTQLCCGDEAARPEGI